MIRAIKIIAILMLLTVVFADGATPSSEVENRKRVILAVGIPTAADLDYLRSFKARLFELGYMSRGKLDLVEIRTDGNSERAETLVRTAFKAGRPDLAVSIGTPASLAAVKVLEGTGVPILFFQVADPVGSGLVAEIDKPTGRAITGRVLGAPPQTRINLVLQLVSQSSPGRPIRFGIIHTDDPSAVSDVRKLEALARSRPEFDVVHHEIPYRPFPEYLEETIALAVEGIEALDEQVDFWIEPADPLGESPEYMRAVMNVSAKPVALGAGDDSVRAGALMHLTPDPAAGGREAADLVAAVLNGVDVGTIPVRGPEKFIFGINLETAGRLNAIVPPELLELAGGHIYYQRGRI